MCRKLLKFQVFLLSITAHTKPSQLLANSLNPKLSEPCAHLADDENVGEPGGKAVPSAVFNMYHIKRARMLLSIGDHTNTPQVSTSGHHANIAYLHRKKEIEMGNSNTETKGERQSSRQYAH